MGQSSPCAAPRLSLPNPQFGEQELPGLLLSQQSDPALGTFPSKAAPSGVLVAIAKDGRSSKPFVFTIHSQQMTHPSQSLDVAADTLEELNDWVAKIREATQNADARVSPSPSQSDFWLLV